MKHDDLISELSARGMIEIPVSGMSMGKSWHDAVSLLVVAKSKRVPRWSDVIVYATPSGLVAHRIVRETRRNGECWWITKGDGFLSPDRIPVPDRDVIGVVTSVRKSGTVISVDAPLSRVRGLLHGLLGRISLIIWPPLWQASKKS